MIRADGQLQRRSVVNVGMAVLRRAQHVGGNGQCEEASSRIENLDTVKKSAGIVI